MKRWWNKLTSGTIRPPIIRKTPRLGPLEDRTLMSITVALGPPQPHLWDARPGLERRQYLAAVGRIANGKSQKKHNE